jgi:alpha-tubulin suppressor-like RCC1 family protein
MKRCKDAILELSMGFVFMVSLVLAPCADAAIGVSRGSAGQRIATGGDFSCAITDSGAVRCWGQNLAGALGDGSTVSRAIPTAVPGIGEPAVSIVAGYYHVCVLTASGGVKCWGLNSRGQLGNDTTESSATPVNVLGLSSGVIAITAGYLHTCAVTSTELLCWGGNFAGQLGDLTTIDRHVPTHVLDGALDAAAGRFHTCVVTAFGSVQCSGSGYRGQLGNGNGTASVYPVQVTGLLAGVSKVSAGDYHTCALISATGALKCWGANWYGELGDATTVDRLEPVDVSSLSSGVTDVHAGRLHTCAIQNGAMKCWGYNNTGRLGSGDRASTTTPVNVIGMSSGVLQIAAGGTQSCAWRGADSFSCWGNNIHGQIGNGKKGHASRPEQVIGLDSGSTAVARGGEHACAIKNGGVLCWGDNRSGQLGDGTHEIRTAPTPVIGIEADATAIVASLNHSCALAQLGVAKCWGENGAGQLGDGTLVERTTPTEVVGLGNGVLQIVTTYSHSCALTAANGVKCWGENQFGELGDNSSINRTTPVDVSGLASGVQAISVGGQRSCALLNSGSVKCWGALSDEFGNPAVALEPVDAPEFGSDVTMIETTVPDCVVNGGQVLGCRGNNDIGQLGNGTTISSWVNPVGVLGLDSGVIDVSGGGEHACAVNAAGAAQCWGINDVGQLGDGTGEFMRLAPVNVIGLETGTASISAGSYGTCALSGSGAIRCWGENLFGQLGIGDTGSVLLPARVLIDEEIFREGFE